MMPYKVYDHDPRNLPQDLLSAIGLAVTGSAQMESIIEAAIAGCAGIDVEHGVAITAHMSAPLRDNVLRSLAELCLDDLDVLDELDVILDKIKNEVLPKRNAIVHNTWCMDPDSGELFMERYSARGSVRVDLIPMSINQIKRDAAFIYQAGIELMTFLLENGLLAPLPTSLRPRGQKTKTARKKRRNARS